MRFQQAKKKPSSREGKRASLSIPLLRVLGSLLSAAVSGSGGLRFDIWRGLADALVHMGFEFGKIVDEQAH